MSKGVFCYRNINRKGVVWSIKSNTTRRVISRAEYVMIKNAKLVVSKAGRRRVLRQKRKNVHAGIKGTWIRGDFNHHVYDWRGMDCIYDNQGNKIGWIRIQYNPYQNKTFVRQDDGSPVNTAEMIILDKDGAWALKPRYEVERKK
jgi:hypothetical protein